MKVNVFWSYIVIAWRGAVTLTQMEKASDCFCSVILSINLYFHCQEGNIIVYWKKFSAIDTHFIMLSRNIILDNKNSSINTVRCIYWYWYVIGNMDIQCFQIQFSTSSNFWRNMFNVRFPLVGENCIRYAHKSCHM